MSLLTDEDIENWKPLLPYPASTAHLLKLLGLQQTKTLKAVAEWYAGDCSVESHPGRPQARVGCMNCKVMLLAALWKGELPDD